MTFEEILDQAIAMLQRRGRFTYRTLQRQFQLDDDALNDLKDELLYAHPEVRDDAGGLDERPAGRVAAHELRAEHAGVVHRLALQRRGRGEPHVQPRLRRRQQGGRRG